MRLSIAIGLLGILSGALASPAWAGGKTKAGSDETDGTKATYVEDNNDRIAREYYLTLTSVYEESNAGYPGLAAVTLEVAHRQFLGIDTHLCWAPTDDISFFGVCATNRVTWISADDDDDDSWGYDTGVSTEATDVFGNPHHIFGIHLDHTVANVGLDPIECGREYKFKFTKGVWHDTITETINCESSPPDPEEECMDCPYGGVYDGAHCYLGHAPTGSTAFIANGTYFYTPPAGGSCEFGDTASRIGCEVSDTPTDTDAFVWNNAYYYDALCE